MQTPYLTEQLSTRMGADWLEEPFFFFVGDTGTPDDFTGCSITGGVYLGPTLKIDLSTASGYTLLSLPNRIDIRVPQSQIDAIGPGVYSVALSLVTLVGETQDLLGFQLKVNRQ